MTDDEIRRILGSVQPSPFLDRTPGTVAILRGRVEEAGARPEDVARWVEARGGRVDRTLPYRLQGRGPRYGPKLRDAEEFYVVPVDALEE